MQQVATNIIQLYRNSFEGLSRDIWLLSLMTLINRSGTMVIVFMTIYLTQSLGWTLTEAGIAMSVFGIGSALGSYIGGWLTDKIGYYKTMFWALVIGGSSFLLLVHMREFYEYCITVFIVSTISDAFRPAVMASISAYSKPENQNRSMSMVRLAINLGFTIGVGAAGIISEYLGFEYLFYIDAITCISAGFFLRWALVEKEDQLTEEEKAAPQRKESPYSDHSYLAFVLFILFSMIVFSQLWNTIPVYFTDFLKISKDNYGFIMIINGILIVILEMPLVYILEKRFHQLTLVVVGTVLITLGFLIFNLTDFWQLAIGICIVAVSLGEIIAFPFSNSYALSRSKPGQRGAYMGMYTMAWSVGAIISPTLGMYIAETYGFPILWYLMTAIGTIAAIGFYLIKVKEGTSIRTAAKVSTVSAVTKSNSH